MMSVHVTSLMGGFPTFPSTLCGYFIAGKGSGGLGGGGGGGAPAALTRGAPPLPRSAFLAREFMYVYRVFLDQGKSFINCPQTVH